MIVLKRGKSEAAIAPEYGGAVVYWRFDGVNILRPAQHLNAIKADIRNAACYPCVPYFGRLQNVANGSGDIIKQDPTFPDADPMNALHGEGWVNAWRLVGQDECLAILEFEHTPWPGRFPYTYKARQRFTICEHSLSIELTIENYSSVPMPAGAGLHPFFEREESTTVRFNADRFWSPPGEDHLGTIGPVPDYLDYSGGGTLPEIGLDHSYAGFGGRAEIINGASRQTMSSDTPHLHLYAPPGAGFFCLEPVTHLPGVFGGVTLAPGDTLNIKMKIGT
ncbi:MAG: hypothetical protein KJN99_03555 [Marinicaulis sp.]|nr:hypothetical protein [Marinicaulis sp.]